MGERGAQGSLVGESDQPDPVAVRFLDELPHGFLRRLQPAERIRIVVVLEVAVMAHRLGAGAGSALDERALEFRRLPAGGPLAPAFRRLDISRKHALRGIDGDHEIRTDPLAKFLFRGGRREIRPRCRQHEESQAERQEIPLRDPDRFPARAFAVARIRLAQKAHHPAIPPPVGQQEKAVARQHNNRHEGKHPRIGEFHGALRKMTCAVIISTTSSNPPSARNHRKSS